MTCHSFFLHSFRLCRYRLCRAYSLQHGDLCAQRGPVLRCRELEREGTLRSRRDAASSYIQPNQVEHNPVVRQHHGTCVGYTSVGWEHLLYSTRCECGGNLGCLNAHLVQLGVDRIPSLLITLDRRQHFGSKTFVVPHHHCRAGSWGQECGADS